MAGDGVKHDKADKGDGANGPSTPTKPGKLKKRVYEAELRKLQAKLVQMQEWVVANGARVVIIFEGRDAAGKGSSIKRITEFLNPRVARVEALPAPDSREKTEWYFQRYVARLPAAGEIVLFDRSWYNRAGVERVMGFCTELEYERFLRQAPVFEQMLVGDGIILIKFWFSVSREEQYRRFQSRADDPMRRWKLSPMDLEAVTRWDAYTAARDRMLASTDLFWARWTIIDSNNKKAARLNAIHHILKTIPWKKIHKDRLDIPPLESHDDGEHDDDKRDDDGETRDAASKNDVATRGELRKFPEAPDHQYAEDYAATLIH